MACWAGLRGLTWFRSGSMGRAWTCATSKTPFRSRAEDILYDEDETMRRKIWICCLLLLLALALPLGAQAAENLVQNGDFSQWDESGLPVGWTYAAWTQDETVSTYWTEEVDGNRCVRLQKLFGKRRAAGADGRRPGQHDLPDLRAHEGGGRRPRAHGRQPLRLREPCRVAGLCGHGRAVGAGRIVWKDRLLPGRDHRGPARGLLRRGERGLGLV